MITPRATRLVRTPSLDAFQHAILDACPGDPLHARATVVLVPTQAAAARLQTTIEDRRLAAEDDALVAPDVLTRAGMYERLRDARARSGRWLSPYEREALLERGAHAAITEGVGPPFQLRPVLVGEMLELYDELLRYQQTVDDFERLLAGELEGQAASDRGAERMLRQTRFLAAAFRWYEREVREQGALDEHRLRTRLLDGSASPWRRVVVTVGDRAAERGGLWPADFDLLTRLAGIEAIDVIATEAQLAAGLHERLHDLLPGLEESRAGVPRERAYISAPAGQDRRHFVSRDREDELADAIRRIRARRRAEGDGARLDRTAIVFARPLPYLYLARELFASAGLPFQCDDMLPLAAEPFAAAVDLVLGFAGSDAGRESAIALLRSPHILFPEAGSRHAWSASVAALSDVLIEIGYTGGADRLQALADDLAALPADASDRGRARRRRAAPAARAAAAAAAALSPLFGRAPAATQLETLERFLDERQIPDADLLGRERRARDAIRAILRGLHQAHREQPGLTWDIEGLTAVVRRWIEAHTFQPRAGDEGVHLVEAVAARYGGFDDVHLVGLLDGEWPERRRRNIFYSSFLLRRLGWTEDAGALSERAAFHDLLRLARCRTAVSTVQLEDEALADSSPLLDELEAADVDVARLDVPPVQVFVHDALMARAAPAAALPEPARRWLAARQAQREPERPEFHGRALPHRRHEYGVGSVELYVQCPFKYFARHVLGLAEEAEERDGLSPRDRGVLVHEALQAFFERWTAVGRGAITPETLDEAMAAFEETAAPLLARLPPIDAALERARLFGSAAAPGIADLVLRMEAERPVAIVARRLEERFGGDYQLAAPAGPRAVPVRGIVDRIDVLADGTLRVLDYKSSVPPVPLQLAVYAVTASERLRAELRRPWRIAEAAYVVYGARREVRPVEGRGADLDQALEQAQHRFVGAVDAMAGGEFPVRPVQTRLCSACAFAGVCRKDYVVDSEPAAGTPAV